MTLSPAADGPLTWPAKPGQVRAATFAGPGARVEAPRVKRPAFVAKPPQACRLHLRPRSPARSASPAFVRPKRLTRGGLSSARSGSGPRFQRSATRPRSPRPRRSETLAAGRVGWSLARPRLHSAPSGVAPLGLRPPGLRPGGLRRPRLAQAGPRTAASPPPGGRGRPLRCSPGRSAASRAGSGALAAPAPPCTHAPPWHAPPPSVPLEASGRNDGRFLVG